jgi:succinate dehydrogenase / fumarate reductase, flavoprotein subunit
VPAAGWRATAAAEAVDRIRALGEGRRGDVAAAALLDELRALMWDAVGPLRRAAGIEQALARLGAMRAALPDVAIPPGRACNPGVADWFELRAGLVAAEAVARAALGRRESRGAHQREDFAYSDAALARRQLVAMRNGVVAAGFDR